jgi:hypothetical protein
LGARRCRAVEGSKVTSDRDCRERRSRRATCRATCAAFDEPACAAESDSGGTLPDHEELVDHHRLHHDPTVPPGKLSIHCRDLRAAGQNRSIAVNGTTRPNARRRSAMNVGSLTTPRSMATGTQCGPLSEILLGVDAAHHCSVRSLVVSAYERISRRDGAQHPRFHDPFSSPKMMSALESAIA